LRKKKTFTGITEKGRFKEENMTELDVALKKLRSIVGDKNLLIKRVDLAAYRDSVHLCGPEPWAVVFPENTQEVSQVLETLNRYQIPVIARGAGTNLCGDTLAQGKTVILEMAKMDRIIKVNTLDRYIAVEPAVSNMAVQKTLAPLGYFFAPDPASFGVSTIGGNIAENAGGMRCVKYGVTTDNVIGLEIVLSNGEVILHKGPLNNDEGYNVTGLMHGSEGTFGVITKAWLRIIKIPEEVKTLVAVFPTLEDAVKTVSSIIGQGIIPSALELIDHLAIQALEETRPMGYPLDAEAVLLIEVDGFQGTLQQQVQRIAGICHDNNVTEIRIARTEEERQLLWLGRREALNCFVSKRPTYAQEDVAVPRAQLPEMLNIIKELSAKHALVVASVCHAGDGNFHPTIIYDDKDEDETKRAHLAFSEMMERAIGLGGTISGEHGIGLEKLAGMELLFSPADLSFMWHLKLAFDPNKILNPGKVIPESIAKIPVKDVAQGSDHKDEHFAPDNFLSCLAKENIGEVFFREEDLKPYAFRGNPPRLVVQPGSVKDLVTLVQLAEKFEMKIIPWGNGTKAARVISGTNSHVIVNMNRFNQILEIDGDNLTVQVEAGIMLKDLQEKLQQKGYFLPADPWETTATIGGMVATNSTGSLKLKYGDLTNLVLGLETVTAGGNIIHYGGKMIKNVAGYDLRKLFIGSWGSLGVITKVTLRIFPLPEKAVSLTYETGDYGTFLDFIFAVQKKDLGLTGFDFAIVEDKYLVHVCISGAKESVDRQREMLDKLINTEVTLLEEKEDHYLISGKAFVDRYLFPAGLNSLSLKSSILFSGIPRWIEKVRGINGCISIYGQAANGILHAYFKGEREELSKLLAGTCRDLKRDLAFGNHTIEGGLVPAPVIMDEGDAKKRLNLNIKQMLDPRNIFAIGIIGEESWQKREKDII